MSVCRWSLVVDRLLEGMLVEVLVLETCADTGAEESAPFVSP